MPSPSNLTPGLINLFKPIKVYLSRGSATSKKLSAQIIAIGAQSISITTGKVKVSTKGKYQLIIPQQVPLGISTAHRLKKSELVPNNRGGENCFFFKVIEKGDLDYLAKLLTTLRKDQHITICAEHGRGIEASDGLTGFEDFLLHPCALPELNFADISLATSCFGQDFSAPLLITGMTGGLSKAAEINFRLAYAATELGIPMGVGSQRLALEHKEFASIFQVKNKISKPLFLIGNIGLAQIITSKDAYAMAMKSIEMIQADALAIHINVVQECIQEEGDRDFLGAFKKIAVLTKRLPVPLLIKEVGCGMDFNTAQKLIDSGVRHLDIGGKGGTSWAQIEGLRADSHETQALGKTFRDWGIPTAYSLLALKSLNCELIATGGIRDGLMVAKALGLGARLTGIGLPLLHAALESEEGPLVKLQEIIRGLKIALLATGCKQVLDLSKVTKPKSFYANLIKEFF